MGEEKTNDVSGQEQSVEDANNSQAAVAGGDVVQHQNNISGNIDREQVKSIGYSISKKMRRLDCADEVKRKCASNLEIVKDEANFADPDKNHVAQTSSEIVRDLKNDPGGISSDTDHFKDLFSTVQLIHPRLGKAKKFLVL